MAGDATSKVIHAKYYKNSNESCIYADWAIRAGLKMSAIFLKYPTYEGVFFMFSWATKVQTYSFCTCMAAFAIKS